MFDETAIDRICPPLPDPDAVPRVLGRAEVLRLGFSRRAISRSLAAGRWRRILPRTYLIVDTLTTADRLVAALVFAGSGAALSGMAALFATEVRRIAPPDRILVLTPPSNRTTSHAWVDVRRTYRPIVTQQWSGPRRVEVARAAADAALTMRGLGDVRALVARVVQDRWCTVAELGVELEAGPRRGSAHLRRALSEVGWGAASAPEAEAADILRRAGITGFVQNGEISLPDGSIRLVDFYWPELRACLEIDSVDYHFDRADWARTWDRHLDLTKLGLSVIHRPPSALRDKRRFVSDVREWLAARRLELSSRIR